MLIKTVLVIAIVTYLIRLSPFLLFSVNKKTPALINYLGYYLPSAVMGMLIIYSIRDINISNTNSYLPILIAITITAVAHILFRNNLVSILLGTIIYMLSLQLVFI